MANDERIKIIFTRIFVKRNTSLFSRSGDFYFIASVGGNVVGNRRTVFSGREGQWINLPEAQWSAIVNVRGRTNVGVQFQCKEKGIFSDSDMGTYAHTLRSPWVQRTFRPPSNRHYILEWRVELSVGGRFGMHAPNQVFAAREHQGSLLFTSVSGTTTRNRIEFHQVCPTPSSAPPARPAFSPGTPSAAENRTAGVTINPTDPINIIPNPAVIPLLTAAEATPQTAARIEYTYYRPNTLAFTDNDARLRWTVVSVAGGGAATFLGPATGAKVLVYGTAAGEVRLEVRFEGLLFATYRALVLPVKRIPCRFNILNGTTRGSVPRATPANVKDHLDITNRFLRQMALELILDPDPRRRDGAVAVPGMSGIFRIRVAPGLTRNIPFGGFPAATRLNFRRNVMNFAYIHSDTRGTLGVATDYPANGAGASITDNGTPSTSWLTPSGVAPESAAGTTTLTLLPARRRPGPAADPARFNQLFGMYVTDTANGDPAVLADQQTYAGTIAHEFGHILNLGHRVDDVGSPFADNLTHPPNENLMHWNNPTTLAQDIDIIQARAAHRSPLVP